MQQSIKTWHWQATGGFASALNHASTKESIKKNNLFLNLLLVQLISIQFTQIQHPCMPNNRQTET
jgi:hypothetical protein